MGSSSAFVTVRQSSRSMVRRDLDITLRVVSDVAASKGTRLIAPDRPGYGHSAYDFSSQL